MPELPEVETVRLQLESSILKRTIQAVEIRDPVILRDSQFDMESILPGQSFSEIRRIGKLLQFFLSDGKHVLLAHLKMTGQFLFLEAGQVQAGIFPLLYASTSGGKKTAGRFREDQANRGVEDLHTHLIFHFEDGSQLAFRDVRKFGYLHLISVDELDAVNECYGPDPLSSTYTLENFSQAFRNRKKSVKGVLMDQSLLAGIGNIYADEICHRVGIRPTTSSSQLAPADHEALYEASKDILNRAIQHGGTTLKDFSKPDGNAGGYSFELQVYGREGARCHRCPSGTITKIVHLQRGTHYCPKCQK